MRTKQASGSTPPPDAFLQQALGGVRVVTRFLERPGAETLDQARQCLEMVVSQMQACAGLLRGGAAGRDPAVRSAAEALGRELTHMNAMFREASVLFGGWNRVLSAKLGGYTRRGAPAPLRCPRNVALKG